MVLHIYLDSHCSCLPLKYQYFIKTKVLRGFRIKESKVNNLAHSYSSRPTLMTDKFPVGCKVFFAKPWGQAPQNLKEHRIQGGSSCPWCSWFLLELERLTTTPLRYIFFGDDVKNANFRLNSSTQLFRHHDEKRSRDQIKTDSYVWYQNKHAKSIFFFSFFAESMQKRVRHNRDEKYIVITVRLCSVLKLRQYLYPASLVVNKQNGLLMRTLTGNHEHSNSHWKTAIKWIHHTSKNGAPSSIVMLHCFLSTFSKTSKQL